MDRALFQTTLGTEQGSLDDDGRETPATPSHNRSFANTHLVLFGLRKYIDYAIRIL